MAVVVACHMQGDQIGRIFAHWAVATLASFFNITKVAQTFWATLSYSVLILTKHGLSYILGDI
jgi:hypothetical protein